MSNFVFEAKRKIRQARNAGQLKRTFDHICEDCASKNLTDYRCETCPLAGVYEVKRWTMEELERQLNALED